MSESLFPLEPDPIPAPTGGAKILLDLWRELCPHLTQPRRVTAMGIKRHLEAAWKREPDEDLWRERFTVVRDSDWLSGRRGDWRADITWATGPKNTAKIDSGAYRNHEARVVSANAKAIQAAASKFAGFGKPPGAEDVRRIR